MVVDCEVESFSCEPTRDEAKKHEHRSGRCHTYSTVHVPTYHSCFGFQRIDF